MKIEEKQRTCNYCIKTFRTQNDFADHWNECPVRIKAGYIENPNPGATGGTMSDVFDGSKIKVSDYPADYIPAGAEAIIGVDYSEDGDYTVKGFCDPKTGEYHIQEVSHNLKLRGGLTAEQEKSDE